MYGEQLEINLQKTVLKLAAEEIGKGSPCNSFIKIAVVDRPKVKRKREAEIAINYRYHLGLLSTGGLGN